MKEILREERERERQKEGKEEKNGIMGEERWHLFLLETIIDDWNILDDIFPVAEECKTNESGSAKSDSRSSPMKIKKNK